MRITLSGPAGELSGDVDLETGELSRVRVEAETAGRRAVGGPEVAGLPREAAPALLRGRAAALTVARLLPRRPALPPATPGWWWFRGPEGPWEVLRVAPDGAGGYEVAGVGRAPVSGAAAARAVAGGTWGGEVAGPTGG